MKIIKTDLIRALQYQLNIPTAQATEVVNAIIEVIETALVAGETVRLSGFGKLFLQTRDPRMYRLPHDQQRKQSQAIRTVQFRPFGKLKERVNAVCIENTEDLSRYMPISERRQTPRKNLPVVGTAIIRVSGIPVCDFKIKDISKNGSAIIVEEDSVMLRNTEVGQEIDIRIHHSDDTRGIMMQRCQITHITKAEEPELQGYYVLGLRILGELQV